jgi:hypothetical protein
MRLAALCHTEMAEELAMLWAVVSSTVESVLGCSPSDTFYIEVAGELAVEFWKMEERCLWLERPTVRICDLLLGPPPGWAQPADHLDKATGQLRVELAARWEADAELEALWTSAARVQDFVLGSADGLSSLAASMSMSVELLEGQIDVVAAKGFCCGSRSVLVAAVSHFPQLEVLGSSRNADLTEDEADALWTWVRAAADSLASYVPSLIVRNPLDGEGE